jgi:hypothetical protein
MRIQSACDMALSNARFSTASAISGDSLRVMECRGFFISKSTAIR